MPLYEYECKKCKKRFEKIRSFSDPPITKCIHCGGSVKKLISPPAIQFKGSGWYVTDYARKGKAQDTEKEKKEEAKTESSEKKESPKKEKKGSSPQSKN